MDEIVEDKLRAMGYRDVPEELAKLVGAWKKRQDAVCPGPISLDALIMCVMVYEMKVAAKARSEKKE